MSAELVPITNVIPNPANPRVLKDERFATLVKSIKDFPEMLVKRPLVVVKHGRKLMVLGGNARLKACAELGMQEVPVIRADDWSDEQCKQFIIKDNVNFGDWDWENIANAWNADELKDWGLQVKEYEAVADYSLLDDVSAEGPSEMMQQGVRRAIQIEYEPSDYEEAFALIKLWRNKGLYIGQFLVEKLKERESA
jgi:ParB-like chromosome segregation protein Spo0J